MPTSKEPGPQSLGATSGSCRATQEEEEEARGSFGYVFVLVKFAANTVDLRLPVGQISGFGAVNLSKFGQAAGNLLMRSRLLLALY